MVKTIDKLYTFYLYSIIAYIIFHSLNFIWQIYEILVLYNFETDAHLLIANALMSSNGALPNIVISLIFLQITINLSQDKL